MSGQSVSDRFLYQAAHKATQQIAAHVPEKVRKQLIGQVYQGLKSNPDQATLEAYAGTKVDIRPLDQLYSRPLPVNQNFVNMPDAMPLNPNDTSVNANLQRYVGILTDDVIDPAISGISGRTRSRDSDASTLSTVSSSSNSFSTEHLNHSSVSSATSLDGSFTATGSAMANTPLNTANTAVTRVQPTDANSTIASSQPIMASPTITRTQPSAASRLKRSYAAAAGLSGGGRRLTGEFDPENAEIKRLRQEENLDFDRIATRLNEARCQNGRTPSITANAVYSRYKRNAPTIAANRGETFKSTAKDNKHIRSQFNKVEPIVDWDDKEDELLVQADAEIRRAHWSMVSKRIQDLGGRHHTPNMCQRRAHCL